MAKWKNRMPSSKKEYYLREWEKTEQRKLARKKLEKQRRKTSSKLYKNMSSEK